MLVKSRDFTAAQIERFTLLQKQVFIILQEVAQELIEGMTETEATIKLRHALRTLDVRSWFHVPVALFGERTAYPGEFGQFEALPSDRCLRNEDAVILDVAPIVDGYLIDCSYAVPRKHADTEAFEKCDGLLQELRAYILTRATERGNMQAIAREVDVMITDRGFENCHKKHIGAVLGHRAALTPNRFLARRRIWGLSPAPVAWFFYKSAQSQRKKPTQTPNWNHSRQCDAPMQNGLWCVEPHVALGQTGVKFEELLLVENDHVRYLGDDLPHVMRWGQCKLKPENGKIGSILYCFWDFENSGQAIPQPIFDRFLCVFG